MHDAWTKYNSTKIEIWWYSNKSGMIKRRLAWALHEDDMHKSRNVRTFFLQKKGC